MPTTIHIDPKLDDAIAYIIQKDKLLADKTHLLNDLTLINNENLPITKKLASYERLIKYLSYLPQWDEELIAYLGNRFMKTKPKEVE